MTKRKKQGKQSFIMGAVVLTAATIIVKIVGMLYKIPLGNLLGADGMALFGIAYSIYSLMLTVSTAGLPVAMSKMISEAAITGRRNQIRRIFVVSMATFLFLGVVGSAVMFFFCDELASFSDPLASYSIMALAPAVLFVCIMSAFRGYSQGHSNMTPSAISQVIEASLKLIIGVVLCWWILKAGYGVEYGSAGAIIGVTIGTVIGAVYMFANALKNRNPVKGELLDIPDSWGMTFKKLISLAVPITIGSCVLSLIALIDTNLIMIRLQNGAGFALEKARDLYGGYYNTQTLFNMPAAFIPPLTISVIPAISSSMAEGRSDSAVKVVQSSVKITSIYALPAAIGLTVLSEPILELFYSNKPELVTIGAPLLSVLGIASFFVCLVLLSNALLQAYGKVSIPVYTMLIGGIVKIVLNYFLVGNSEINIMGAPISTVACYGTIAIINIIALYKYVPGKIRIVSLFIKPLFASIIMGGFAYAAYDIINRILGGSNLSVLVTIGAAVIVYFVVALLLRVVTKEDLELIPKGDKIAKILRLK